MKRNIFHVLASACLIAGVACNNGTQTVTSDSTTTMGTTGDTTASATTTQSTTSATSATQAVHLNPNTSYVDLKTGKSVKLRVDTVTKYIVNEVTNQPIMFYIDPATRDTFDRQGRLVNRALIRGTNGDYTVDETLLSSGTNDNTMSGADTTTRSTSPAASGSSKEKMKDDKYKYKDDNTKIKAKDDKAKVKTNP